MLVLSRQLGERLVIDGQIEVTVVEIRPDRVKLGVSAPPEISVHREEVFRRITAATAEHCVEHRPEESRFMAEFA
jgi:carbon storage regulator